MTDLKPTDVLLPSGRVIRNGAEYGCHCDIADDEDVDGCVIDSNAHEECIFAYIKDKKRRSRWTCSEWKRVRK